MIVYCNGDSFVAGVELGDDAIIGWPGNRRDNEPNRSLILNKWYQKTLDPGHHYGQNRIFSQSIITSREESRRFSKKIKDALGCEVINHAQGGASFDRIVRTTMIDLLKLKAGHNDIVAVIGTTDPSRLELACDNGWNCIHINEISNATSDYQKSLVNIITHHLHYEKNYHSMVKFYKNVILLQDFCKLNGIKLLWVSGSSDVDQTVEVADNELGEDLILLKEYANFKHDVSMQKIVNAHRETDTTTPGHHYSEFVHNITAQQLIELIDI